MAPKKAEYDAVFKTLRIDASGRANGMSCMAPLQATGCPQETLKTIWDLADIDKDGCLDADEFAVAMHLCAKAKEGEVLPAELPPSIVPPSKGATHTPRALSALSPQASAGSLPVSAS